MFTSRLKSSGCVRWSSPPERAPPPPNTGVPVRLRWAAVSWIVVGVRPDRWVRMFLGPARHLNLYCALKSPLALTLCLSHGLTLNTTRKLSTEVGIDTGIFSVFCTALQVQNVILAGRVSIGHLRDVAVRIFDRKDALGWRTIASRHFIGQQAPSAFLFPGFSATESLSVTNRNCQGFRHPL